MCISKQSKPIFFAYLADLAKCVFTLSKSRKLASLGLGQCLSRLILLGAIVFQYFLLSGKFDFFQGSSEEPFLPE